ncbi:MAG TPA: transcriptional regulator [Nocardioidaceae bacterium]|nr:transcriptional regulator [Nocardioidaceae bacterium]
MSAEPTGPTVAGLMENGMRAEVAESWHRSAAAGVHVDTVDAPITLPDDVLRDYREAHPLAQVFPLLDDVLGQAARDCDTIMAVSDASGQLLWICGNPSVLRMAESIGFVEGSNWDERLAGTNAPGMAIAIDRTATVIGAEHFRRSVQRWSCAATPIHDPASSSLLGVLDITGGESIVKPETVAMVRAAARMAESEMARALLTRREPEYAEKPNSLHVMIESLGRGESLVTVHDGSSKPKTIRLSPRHSEILLLLASAPRGLSGDELAVLLYEDDGGESTLRAELNRLRHLLGAELLASRPYRLAATVTGDWLAVEAMLAAGDVTGAMRAYRGPLLPRSQAPGVQRLRDEVSESLRQAILRSGSPDLMSTWTRSSWGSDDYDMWLAQRAAIGTSSPLLPLVDGQIARLDRELGL